MTVALSYLAFEFPRGTQGLYTRFQDILREALAPSVHVSQSKMIVTYSLRRFGGTLTRILEVDPGNEYAVGGWTARGASKEANDIRRGMPTVYNGRRATMEEVAKTALGATTTILLVEVAACTQSPTLEDVHTAASRVTPDDRYANLVFLKELHKATMLTSANPKEVAYGVDPCTAVERRFMVKKEGISKLTTRTPRPMKMELPLSET